jgi:hypothetical protein
MRLLFALADSIAPNVEKTLAQKSYFWSMDFVILWVDGADPDWLEQKRCRQQELGVPLSPKADAARYRDWGILRYWFRGVEAFAPWVRKVHFVTCGHKPKWLNTEHPKLHFVKHSDFIAPEHLPTFSSSAIEIQMHKIPGLAPEFVFFNDDMFLLRPAQESDFFVDGLPVDEGALSLFPIRPRYQNGNFGRTLSMAANVAVTNALFPFRDSMRKERRKWFSLRYAPSTLALNALASVMPYFLGFIAHHAGQSFLRSTFEELWVQESVLLKQTAARSFRGETNVTQYLFRFAQLAQGKFEPKNFSKRKMQLLSKDSIESICRHIERQDLEQLCINDSEFVELGNFEDLQQKLILSFQKILPQKSGFEKNSFEKEIS